MRSRRSRPATTSTCDPEQRFHHAERRELDVPRNAHPRPGVRRRAYGTDEQLVRRLLLRSARKSTLVLRYPPPRSGSPTSREQLDFALLAWFRNPADRGQFLNEIRFEISRVFRENRVVIPVPSPDAHDGRRQAASDTIDRTRRRSGRRSGSPPANPPSAVRQQDLPPG